MRFRNRTEAGRHLARRLTSYAGRSDVVVLALPRGGVPVAAEVARALGAPLDVFLVRKLGVPGHAELAMGAIAEGGAAVLNDELVASLQIPPAAIDQVTRRERAELDRRQRLYRGSRQPPSLDQRTVILIDDGLATGSTVEAAILALRARHPARIVVAVPVGARESCERIGRLADEVVCAEMPAWFNAVGQWYDDFSETTDEEVKALLASPAPAVPAHGGGAPREIVGARARRLSDPVSDVGALVEAIADARVVLLGEATHGTHEFYAMRAEISRRLIADHGFSAVAVEADWPDAYRVNRFVRGGADDATAAAALSGFQRFPAWMWRNSDVLAFVEWLRAHNQSRSAEARAGFYGLDLYSLHASMRAVLKYLAKIDPAAAERARQRYACFDRFGGEPQDYGYAATAGLTPSCEHEVLTQLLELRRRAADYASRDGRVARDDYFFAEQNARLVANAEAYYRTMFRGRVESWNLRDRHMADTLGELLRFLARSQPDARVIVWAHNSHVGDARATEMGDTGELNVGQLVRQTFGASAVLVGFTTHTGTVTAASEWDGPAERKTIQPSLEGSYERLFHDAGLTAALLPIRSDPELAAALAEERLERAIGVIYLPSTERRSHYFKARLSEQFDYVVHIDDTTAVQPLERVAPVVDDEVEETYPSGL